MTTADTVTASTADSHTSSMTIDNIALSRGDQRLMDGLSFTVSPGEALFLVGKNGVGKTTLLRTLAGLIRPDAGQVLLNGKPVTDTAPDQIGWLGHADGLKGAETVRQALRFWAEMYGRPRTHIMPALKQLGIHHLIDRRTDRMSRGQQRRTGLARVVMSDRPIWLLDEPAGPLDAVGRDRLADVVRAHRDRGGIVIAATHQVLDWPHAHTLALGGA